MTSDDYDPLFDAEVKRQVGPFVTAYTGADPSCVDRLPVDMVGDAIAIHIHPCRNDMPLLIDNQSPWCWVLAHGVGAPPNLSTANSASFLGTGGAAGFDRGWDESEADRT